MLSNFKHYDLGFLVLRIILGVCVLMHGIYKLSHGILGVESMIVSAGLPQWLSYGVYVGEILAPMMIIFGVATRLGALFLLINSAVILYVAHGANLFALSKFGGFSAEIVFLYIAGALCLIFCGGGRYCLTK